MKDFFNLPQDLPVPQDDGACDHLVGLKLPFIELKTTDDRIINLSEIINPTVIFFYPRTGIPNEPVPEGWDLIPGARGCTPQSCGFRDLYSEFKHLGFQIFGCSTQNTSFQKEFVQRNHIPFEILSDEKFQLTDKLRLPTFVYNQVRLLKRMAWVTRGGAIQKVFYPVFPPNENAVHVLKWLSTKELL